MRIFLLGSLLLTALSGCFSLSGRSQGSTPSVLLAEDVSAFRHGGGLGIWFSISDHIEKSICFNIYELDFGGPYPEIVTSSLTNAGSKDLPVIMGSYLVVSGAGRYYLDVNGIVELPTYSFELLGFECALYSTSSEPGIFIIEQGRQHEFIRLQLNVTHDNLRKN